MSQVRKKADWPIIAGAILALGVVALGAYVGGYFALAKTHYASMATLRSYPSPWLASIYKPASKVESLLKGRPVYAIDEEFFNQAS
jgi:hypothetical protein